jgi:RimJ/RimL family protein N-acetyltransferase
MRWLNDTTTQRFILQAQQKQLSELKAYIKSKIDRSDVLFLGIFDLVSGDHIGNIKYEPVNTELGYAIMGMLIGDVTWRGKGVAGEVLEVTAKWLVHHKGIKQILLGVARENTAAIRAYERAGFIVSDTPYIRFSEPGNISMVWNIGEVF